MRTRSPWDPCPVLCLRETTEGMGWTLTFASPFFTIRPWAFFQPRRPPHLLSSQAASTLWSSHSWLWTHHALRACCSSSGCFLCSQCPLPFLWIALALLSQSVFYVQLMGHQMACGSTQTEFLLYAIYISLGLRHSEQRHCIYNSRGGM